MPIARFQMPDGRIARFEVPAGTSPEQAQGLIEQFVQAQSPDKSASPTQGGATLQIGPLDTHIPIPESVNNFLAGAGRGMVNVARGVGELIGTETPKDIDEARRRDKPLMDTTAGKVGNFFGAAAPVVAAALIPGANTVIGSAAVGAGLGAIEPVGTGESRAKNVALGAVTGGGTAGVMKGIGKAAESKIAGMAAKKAANAGQDAAAAEAKDTGYVLPPTQAKPSVLNQILEGVSGKIKTAQNASTKNQAVTNGLVRKAMGLPEDAPISTQTLDAVRERAGQAYEVIKSVKQPFRATPQYRQQILSLAKDYSKAAKEFPALVKNEGIENLVDSLNVKQMSPTAAVELMKKLRFDASANLKARDNPARLALGLAQRKAAAAIEGLAEANLKKTGQLDTLFNFQKSRDLIAKSYDVESALNDATGNVSARDLAKLLEKGKPLTAELRTIAKTAQSFPKAMQDVEKIGSQPAISPLDVAAGGISAAASGHLLPLSMIGLRPAVRAAILSKAYQKVATTPNYEPGTITTLSQMALSNPYVQRLVPAITTKEILERRH